MLILNVADAKTAVEAILKETGFSCDVETEQFDKDKTNINKLYLFGIGIATRVGSYFFDSRVESLKDILKPLFNNKEKSVVFMATVLRIQKEKKSLN